MTFPGMHRDTHIEECHRHFFSRYALGFPPEKCGALEKHNGGLVGIVPIRIKLRPSARKFPPEGGNHGSRGVSLMRMGGVPAGAESCPRMAKCGQPLTLTMI